MCGFIRGYQNVFQNGGTTLALVDRVKGVSFSRFLPRYDTIRLFRWDWVSQMALSGKEPTCHCRRHERCKFSPWDGKIPWRRAWQPTPAFLLGESLGQRNLASYSP